VPVLARVFSHVRVRVSHHRRYSPAFLLVSGVLGRTQTFGRLAKCSVERTLTGLRPHCPSSIFRNNPIFLNPLADRSISPTPLSHDRLRVFRNFSCIHIASCRLFHILVLLFPIEDGLLLYWFLKASWGRVLAHWFFSPWVIGLVVCGTFGRGFAAGKGVREVVFLFESFWRVQRGLRGVLWGGR